MRTTRRRKIARSVAIRRVKPNAKRKERKTQKRKSRNIVMKGGVHKNLKVYLIQKKPGTPNCIIIRQHSFPKDTIYLFFHSQMTPVEIKEFVCAAMGLDIGTVITPELQFTSSKDKEFNGLFIQLSGNYSYTLSSGQLYIYVKNPIISKIQLQSHETPKIAMTNGEAIIESLRSKTLKKGEYTFTEFTEGRYFNNEKFDLDELKSLFDSVMKETYKKLKKHCPDKAISPKIDELKQMISQQKSLIRNIEGRAMDFYINNVEPGTTKDQHKQQTVATAMRNVIDIEKATNLIEEIKSDPEFSTCKVLFEDKSLEWEKGKDTTLEYIDGTTEFTPKDSIQQVVDDAYLVPYQNP